jgi:hypothetical protein
MPTHFGDKWMKQVVHKSILDEWKLRLASAKTYPPSQDPLEFAYLADLLAVMQRGDVWDKICAPVFPTKEDFVATFQRLSVVRNPIAHAGTLSQVDFAMGQVDAVRLLLALGVSVQIRR